MLFPLALMNRLNKTESVVLLYCRFSLFLKDTFFQIIEWPKFTTCKCCRRWDVSADSTERMTLLLLAHSISLEETFNACPF